MKNKLKYIVFFVFICILSFLTYSFVYADTYNVYLNKLSSCVNDTNTCISNYETLESLSKSKTYSFNSNVENNFVTEFKASSGYSNVNTPLVSLINLCYSGNDDIVKSFTSHNRSYSTTVMNLTDSICSLYDESQGKVLNIVTTILPVAFTSGNGVIYSPFEINSNFSYKFTFINSDLMTLNEYNSYKQQLETKEEIKKGFEECRDSYNLLVPSFRSITRNGLTLSFNENGFIVNGTSTQQFDFFVISSLSLSSGTYIVNGIPGSSGSTYQLLVYDKTQGKVLAYIQNDSRTFTLTSTSEIELRFYPYFTSYDNKLFQYQLEKGTTTHPYEQYGKEICKNRLDSQKEQQEKNHKETMDTITNSDSSDATNDASGFFEGFSTDTFGLTSIITAPLNLIKSITSKTCSPLSLEIPFVDKTMQLPCMSTIYSEYFGTFLTIYQTITFGIISYWVCIRIFALVKDFKNPDHDEIEVMDL